MMAMLNINVMFVEKNNLISNFLDKADTDIYFYENALSNYYEIEEESSDALKFIENIKNIDGVIDVGGYRSKVLYLEKGVTFENMEDNYCNFNCLDNVSLSISYELEAGTWFDKLSNSDEVEVVIGGPFAEKYVIGDEITLYGEDSSIYTKCKVVGIFKKNQGILNLDVYSMNKVLISTWSENFIVTNNTKFLAQNDVYYGAGLLLKLKDDFDKDSLLKYGGLYSLNEMFGNSGELNKDINKTFIMDAVMYICIFVFSSFSIIYYQKNRRIKADAIYYLLGIYKKQYVKDTIIENFIIYAVGIAIMFLITPIISSHTYLSEEIVWRKSNLLITFLTVVTMIIINTWSISHIYKKSVTETIKQNKLAG